MRRQDLRSLVTELIDPVGLSLTGPVETHEVRWRFQQGDNDLIFLNRLLGRLGLGIACSGTKVRLVSAVRPSASATLRIGGSLTELTISRSDRAATSVVATGWDPELAAPVEGRSTRSRVDVLPGSDGGGDTTDWHYGLEARSRREADAIAQSMMDSGRCDAVVAEGVAVGEPGLAPGVKAEFRSLSDKVLGRHVLAVVDHHLTGAGLVSTFSTQGSALPSPPDASTSILRGVVDDVADPEGRCRVRLRLPTVGDVVTPWLDLLLPGANKRRGLIAVPDIGDLVVAAFPNGDLAAGIVLGATLPRQGSPSDVIRDGRVRRQAWHTSRGQSIVLDDRAGSVTMTNRSGSRVRLGGDLVELHSECDLVLEAPGNTITIRAAAVAFEETS